MLQKKVSLVATIAASALFISACASTPEECDPRLDPGFLSKIGCSVTGSYQERIDQKEQTVANLKKENEDLNNLLKSLNEQDALLKNDIQKRQHELDVLSSRVADLQQSLKEKQALNQDRQNAFAEIQKQLAQMKMESQSEYEQKTLLEKQMQVQNLEQELEDLSELMLNTSY